MDKPYSIALVDDDEAIRKAMEDLFDAEGVPCLVFDSAEQFLADHRLPDIACLVLDVNLPGMSGLELQKRLVETGFRAPIMFLTSVDEPSMKLRALQNGALAYLLKPVSGCVLLEWVRNGAGDE